MSNKKLLDYKWGSNIPAIRAIMDFFSPSGVLELGIGKHSTPLLYQYNKKLVSIETDADWIESVKEVIKPRDNFQIIHHGLDINQKTKFYQVSEQIKQECVKFYKQYISSDLEFLFVDHVSGLRASSLLALFDRFKYVAYHDAEHLESYNYQILTKEKSKDYIHMISKTPLVHTGILIHKNYAGKIKDFVGVLHRNNKEYCSMYDIKYENNIVFV